MWSATKALPANAAEAIVDSVVTAWRRWWP